MKKIPLLWKGLIVCIVLFLLCTSTLSATHLPPKTSTSQTSCNERWHNNPCSPKTVPDCVEIGDLFLFDFHVDQSNVWKRPGLYNEHAAIYVGNNTFVEANGIVRYRNYSSFYESQKNLVFLRVQTANESQRYAAVAWAISKIGLGYQDFFVFPWFGLKIADTDRSFPTARELYCMELIWAAYYIQGIDIDRNGWRFPWWVTGNDIIYDDDIEIIYREVDDSTEIVKPYKGVYVANRKTGYSPYSTMVFGSIDIVVHTSNERITYVDFYIDSVYKSTDTSPPYVWRWNEPGSGEKVITAIASDDEGNHYEARMTVLKYF
jgi:hypothetical protein